ncbi:MAG: TerC family protein [Bacteroidales bacterium]
MLLFISHKQDHHPLIIAGFALIILVMLLIDLGVFNKKAHKVSSREAIRWSFFWIFLSFVFAALVWMESGHVAASDFVSAYLIEKALSMDNIFVFILIFRYFSVPEEYQHKVLFYGIIGAIVFRALFIFAGVGLIKLTYLPPFVLWGREYHINLLMAVFGLFLVYAGIKSWNHKSDESKDFSKNWIVRIAHALFPFTPEFAGSRFFIRQAGRLLATPLFLVVLVIEGTDVMFAVDSIPAIFAVTDDPFILYTSNIFAILGLRSLYFLFANLMPLFRFLHYGLAIILTFIGGKMLLDDIWQIEISSPLSLSIVAGVLVISVLASLIIKEERQTKTGV